MRMGELDELFRGHKYLGQCSNEPDWNTHLVVILADTFVLNPNTNGVRVDGWLVVELEFRLVLEVVVDVTLCLKIELRGEAEDEVELGEGGLQP